MRAYRHIKVYGKNYNELSDARLFVNAHMDDPGRLTTLEEVHMYKDRVIYKDDNCRLIPYFIKHLNGETGKAETLQEAKDLIDKEHDNS